eukprot:443554-Rhodomonas_salina.1
MQSSDEESGSSPPVNTANAKDWKKRVRDVLILYLMPMFYGGITRLPFIYFVIHLVEVFGLDWVPVGLLVGGYQACRVLTNIGITFAPKIFHLFGTLASLAGFSLVWATDIRYRVPFMVGTCIVGFAETMAAMQLYAKEEYSREKDLQVLKRNLKVQYASVMVGVTLAFLFGGLVYQRLGVHGVAGFGAILSGLELVSFLLFLAVSVKHSSPQEPHETQHGADGPASTAHPAMKVSFTRLPSKSHTDALGSFSGDEFHATWVNYLIAVTMGVEAIVIGYNLSIGPIFVLNEFKQNTTTIGILFAAGAASGTVAAVTFTLTDAGERIMRRLLPSPWDIYVPMAGIATAVLVAAVPVFEVHVLGLILIMAFNDLAATILTEVQGAIATNKAYSFVGPFGQIVRRSLNVVTAVTGPFLFGVWPRLPYMVAGGLSWAWVILIVVLIERRRRSNAHIISEYLETTQTENPSERANATNANKFARAYFSASALCFAAML